MAIYLGSTQIDQGSSRYMYLGDQQICKAYLGTTEVFDNCGFTPVTVTMLYSGSPGGTGGSAGYTIGGPSSGSTQSGQAGVDSYSFTNTIAVNTAGGYSGTVWLGSSSNSTSTSTPVSRTLAGTIPSADTTVYQIFGGSTTAPVSNQTDEYEITKIAALTQGTVNVAINGGTGGVFDEITGAPGTNYTIDYTYTGASSGYTYTGIQITIGGGSAVNMTNPLGDGYTWVYSDSSNITGKSVTANVGGTESASAQSYYVKFTRDVASNPSQGEFDYSISGATGSGNTTGNLNSSNDFDQTATLVISTTPSSTITIGYTFDTFSGGYQFTTDSKIQKGSVDITMPDVITASSLSTTSGSPTTYNLVGTSGTSNDQANINPVADSSYGYGPYTSLSTACSDRNSGSIGASADFNYFNGGEGILPPFGETISQTWNIDTGLGSPLTNFRWFVTTDQQDSNGDNIVFYYYNGIDNTVTCP
jgi:hypothetical protein